MHLTNSPHCISTNTKALLSSQTNNDPLPIKHGLVLITCLLWRKNRRNV